MVGCPHRMYWHIVSEMRRTLDQAIQMSPHLPTVVYPLPPTFGFSGQASHLSVLRNSTALDGQIEAAVSSFRSFTMDNQPASGLVEQSTDGSLSISCPVGQWVLAGIDYSEVELRLLSLSKMCYQPYEYTKRDTIAWLYSGQP